MRFPGRGVRRRLGVLCALLAAVAACSDGSSQTNPGPDMAVQGPPLGMPITAPLNTWTWVDFPDSSCDDGSPTGVAINPSGGKNLLIFMNGGGACWDYLTCVVINSAAHGPFGRAEFDAAQKNIPGSILDRTAPNPVRDYNLVFIPYCTGDVHSGDNIATYQGIGQTYQVRHRGRANLRAFLARLAATFQNPDKLVVSGSSAGGFGTALNYDLFRQYFPQTQGKAYLLDDSGPTLRGDAISASLRSSWYQSWNLDAALHDLCPGCANDFSAMLPIVAAKYPKDRLALLSYTQDQVIRAFFTLSADAFQADLYDLATTVIDPLPNMRYFVATGTAHTFLGAPGGKTSQGVELWTWLGQLLNDDPSWSSVKP